MKQGKKLVGMGVLCTLAATSTFGATITFAPTNASVTAGTPITTDLELFWAVPVFNSHNATILLGSNDATDLSFSIDAAWTAAFTTVPAVVVEEFGNFAQEVTIRGEGNTLPGSQTSVMVGTLTIDTTGMANGNYSVGVDDTVSELEIFDEETVYDSISGAFSFTIVPEPATLSLLALGGLAASRRRR